MSASSQIEMSASAVGPKNDGFDVRGLAGAASAAAGGQAEASA